MSFSYTKMSDMLKCNVDWSSRMCYPCVPGGHFDEAVATANEDEESNDDSGEGAEYYDDVQRLWGHGYISDNDESYDDESEYNNDDVYESD